MKKTVLLFIVCSALYYSAFSQSVLCNGAYPFCSGTTYNYPASVNAPDAESGPNYGCLFSQPNPAWYYMQVAQPGNFVIYLHSQPQVDIDFACWGPFNSPTTPCTAQLTANCSSCPNNTSDPNFYPSGNLVDCSYSTSWEETVHINNAVTGQYYIFLITNYSNDTCNIIFDQTNLCQPGVGTTDCGYSCGLAYTDGPVCEGDTIRLHADTIQNTTYYWTGPDNFVSSQFQPVIPNATMINAGTYTCTFVYPTGSFTDTAVVTVMPNPTVSVTSIATGTNDSTLLIAEGAISYQWNTSQTNDSIIVTPAATTTYYVTGTDVNGCIDTAQATVIINPDFIEKNLHKKQLIEIYPNPAENILYIKNAENKDIEIYDILGNIKWQTGKAKSFTSINTREFPKGYYFVKIKNGTSSITRKITIE